MGIWNNLLLVHIGEGGGEQAAKRNAGDLAVQSAEEPLLDQGLPGKRRPPRRLQTAQRSVFLPFAAHLSVSYLVLPVCFFCNGFELLVVTEQPHRIGLCFCFLTSNGWEPVSFFARRVHFWLLVKVVDGPVCAAIRRVSFQPTLVP